MGKDSRGDRRYGRRLVSVKWKNNRDMRTLSLEIDKYAERVKDRSFDALVDAVDYGSIELQDRLEAAVTPTGLAREERGGFPGRHRTGNMIASVSNNTHTLSRRSKIFAGLWGWFAGEFEQYMKDQDAGLGKIPAAGALPGSFFSARERLHKNLRAIIGHKS